jgi:hypothetical protein
LSNNRNCDSYTPAENCKNKIATISKHYPMKEYREFGGKDPQTSHSIKLRSQLQAQVAIIGEKVSWIPTG